MEHNSIKFNSQKEDKHETSS